MSTRGFEYSRTGNPTRASLETTLSALEGACARVLLRERHGGRGRAAPQAGAGDHLIIPNDAYGGTFRLVDKVLRPTGISYYGGGPDRSRRARSCVATAHPARVGRDAE